MTWLYFIAATLACFRLTRLITDDKITDWLRRDVSKAGQKAREGIHCPFCVSFYWSMIIAIALVISLNMPWYSWAVWFAPIWGGSVLWNQVFVKLSD